MATGTGVSLLVQKLGAEALKNAYEAGRHHKPELSGGGSDWPPGVDAVCQLKSFRVEPYKDGVNAGKLRAIGMAVAVEPETFVEVIDKQKGVFKTWRIKGKQSWFREDLFDKPNSQSRRKTLADHLGYVMDLLKILGLSQVVEQGDPLLLEQYMAMLEKKRPFFGVRTYRIDNDPLIDLGDGRWQLGEHKPGKPAKVYASKELLLKANPYAEREPMVNHDWFNGGVIPNYVPPSTSVVVPGGGMQDDTAAPVNGSGEGQATVPAHLPKQQTFQEAKAVTQAAQVLNPQSRERLTKVYQQAQPTIANPRVEPTVQEAVLQAAEQGQPFDEFQNDTPGEEDVEALGRLADHSPTTKEEIEQVTLAEARLKELAREVGIEPEVDDEGGEIWPGEDWSQLAMMIDEHRDLARASAASDETTVMTPAVAVQPTPKVTDVVAYQPEGKNPRTKKPYERPVQCQVLAVNTRAETADLGLLSDGGKTKFAGVPWDRLAEAT